MIDLANPTYQLLDILSGAAAVGLLLVLPTSLAVTIQSCLTGRRRAWRQRSMDMPERLARLAAWERAGLWYVVIAGALTGIYCLVLMAAMFTGSF